MQVMAAKVTLKVRDLLKMIHHLIVSSKRMHNGVA